uniref:Uncharacterized protein n=1 Tax=Panagrolaimus davidi TaxID=227884 RepID=A0A914QY73_9BILA
MRLIKKIDFNCVTSNTNFVTIASYQIVGAYIFIPLFIIPSIFCLIYLYLRLPETLKKETHEIHDSMRARRKQIKESLCPSESLDSFN